jgi:hypothetical protein
MSSSIFGAGNARRSELVRLMNSKTTHGVNLVCGPPGDPTIGAILTFQHPSNLNNYKNIEQNYLSIYFIKLFLMAREKLSVIRGDAYV